MTWKDIPWRPTDRVLRQFSGLWIAATGLIAWRVGVFTEPTHVGLGITLAIASIGIAGLIAPVVARWPFLLATLVTLPIGWCVSQLVLATLFFGVFTPVAWVFRWRGRQALALAPCPQSTTYWEAKNDSRDAAQYLRQF